MKKEFAIALLIIAIVGHASSACTVELCVDCTSDANGCDTCSGNYVYQGGSACICQSPNTAYNGTCNLCSITSCSLCQTDNVCNSCSGQLSVVNNTCQCTGNFVQNGTNCNCNSPFVVSGSTCQCPTNFVQSGTSCNCNSPFV